MVDTQNSGRGLTYEKATDLVLGYFLEAWWKISAKKKVDAEGNLCYSNGNVLPDLELLDNDTPIIRPFSIHFDNVDKSTCLVSYEEAMANGDSAPPLVVCYNGENYKYATKQFTDTPAGTNTDGVTSSELVIRHAGSFQDTLGGRGNRSFVRNGVLVIKLNINIQKGLTELYKCANIIAECFEGRQTNSSLWFQSVEINEGGVDGTSYKSEVVIAFQYDQVK